MKIAAVFDLDGTLVNMPKKYWHADEFNWPNFINWMDEQKQISSTVEMVRWHLVSNHGVLVVTARPESYREETIALLEKHGINYDDLIMRTDEEVEVEKALLAGCENQEDIKSVLFKQHAIYRKRVALELQSNGVYVIYAYDDQVDNLRVWKDVFGTSCWEVKSDGTIEGAKLINYGDL